LSLFRGIAVIDLIFKTQKSFD